jgi:hypothetical protein
MEKKYMSTSDPIRQIIIALLLTASALPAAAQFNVEEYLSRAATELDIQSIQAQRQYIKDANFRSPLLREVEFRMRARDMQEGIRDYRFRVSPLNPFERRANKEHTKLLAMQLESESLVAFSSVLNRRYKLLIEYYYLTAMEKIGTDENTRYGQLMKAWRHQGNAGEELIELDRRILLNDLQLEDLKAEQRELAYLIRMDYEFSGDIDLSSFAMVTVDQVNDHLVSSEEGQNIYVLNEENKAQISQADWEINKQESFSNLGYLQAEYRAYRGETINENLGFQLALQLPIVNPDRPDLARRRLDVIEDEQEVKEVEREVNLTIFSRENDLKTKIAQFQRLEKKLASFDAIPPSGYSNAKAMLELVNYKHDLSRRITDLYESILRLYIDWLDYKGLLSTDPLLNYLSASRTPLE